MTTTAGYFDKKPSSTIRPGLSHLQREPGSPHTPQRTYSSTFNSPSASYLREEEAVVFELGARHLTAGFAGDSAPRCRLGFGPEEARRVGDYRRWSPGYADNPKRKKAPYLWGEDHELWRMDLGNIDPGLVEDKIERAAREAHSKYLLLDSKSRRVFLVLPSVLPHQLLSNILSTLFSNFQTPSITLLSTPVLCTVAAGCRSGLVVDIGWSETIVTALYELSEVNERRTTRAMKMTTLQMAKLLYLGNEEGQLPLKSDDSRISIESMLSSHFEQSEEIVTRLAWCPIKEESARSQGKSDDISQDLKGLATAEDSLNKTDQKYNSQETPLISIPPPLHPRQTMQLPFSEFAKPVEEALLAKSKNMREFDDHELPLHLLIYRSLLSLPADVRAICMPRIIITGGGSNIPGLKSRLLEEVISLVKQRGWDPAEGKAADERRKRLKEISSNRRAKPSTSDPLPVSIEEEPAEVPKPKTTGLEPQEPDPIEDKIRYEEAKGSKPTVSGFIRGVETLGAWAGGSLVAGLKIKGIVEVDRESFLQYGLAGAKRDSELNTAAQRQSLGPGMTKAGIGGKAGWTLGAWA